MISTITPKKILNTQMQLHQKKIPQTDKTKSPRISRIQLISYQFKDIGQKKKTHTHTNNANGQELKLTRCPSAL